MAVISYQRKAAAVRAVKREAASMALFPELRRWNTVEDRIAWGDQLKADLLSRSAREELEWWERDIRIFNELSDGQADQVAAGLKPWNMYTPHYFGDMMTTIIRETKG